MSITLAPHANALAGLAASIEAEAAQAKRRADLLYSRTSLGEPLTDGEEGLADYNRGAQDALDNIAGRLRAILMGPLGAVLDLGEVFDAVEAELTGNGPRTAGQAATVVIEVLSARKVRGTP